MALTPAETIALQTSLGRCLDCVKACFKPGAKVTLVVRNPSISDEAGVVISDDDLDEAITEIKRRQVT